MTTARPLQRVEAPTTCNRCREPLIVTVGVLDRRRKMLAPTPVAGGLYQLDSKGRAVRRALRDMRDELLAKAACHGGGYNTHTCARSGRPR